MGARGRGGGTSPPVPPLSARCGQDDARRTAPVHPSRPHAVAGAGGDSHPFVGRRERRPGTDTTTAVRRTPPHGIPGLAGRWWAEGEPAGILFAVPPWRFVPGRVDSAEIHPMWLCIDVSVVLL